MARNGSGTYSRVAGTPYVYDTVINQATVNSEMDDIATALTNSLAKDGQTVPTANIPLGGYRLTGVGAATATTDALTAETIPGVADKAAPVDADLLPLVDSEAANALKKLTWANVKATQKTYFDSLYLALAGGTLTGNLSFAAGKGINENQTTMANHATNADIWAAANTIFFTSAVTVTAIPNSPGPGVTRRLFPSVGTVYTHDGGNINIQGGASYTTAAGDMVLVISQSTTLNCLIVTKADGMPVAGAASQSEQEAGSSTVKTVTPGRQHFHPSAAKAWINWNGTGTPAVRASYNMDPTTPITDNGTGDYTLNLGTDMSSANYCAALSHGSQNGSVSLYTMGVSDGEVATHMLAGSLRVKAYQAATLTDFNWMNAVFFGDQA